VFLIIGIVLKIAVAESLDFFSTFPVIVPEEFRCITWMAGSLSVRKHSVGCS